MITLNDLDTAIRQLAFSNGAGMVQRRFSVKLGDGQAGG